MLLIPLNTDAPVYAFPWATLGLIGLNTAVTIAAAAHPAAAEQWMLQYGDGLHPLQWITSSFIHGGGAGPVGATLHLLGNMAFLWGFGLVIEGKLGWLRFLAVYFGIGAVQCAFEQALMLGHEYDPFGANGSCGASSIIFGLMAMALVWAPKNELTILLVFFMIRIFVHTFEITILTFSLWTLGIEAALMFLSGFSGSSLLHVMGAAVGFPLAVAMLRLRWVDCEGWDLFSVMEGTAGDASQEIDPLRWQSSLGGLSVLGRPVSSGRSSSRNSRAGGEAPPSTGMDEGEEAPGTPRASSLRKLRNRLEAGKPTAALAEYHRLRTLFPTWRLGEDDHKLLTGALYRGKFWNDVIPLLEEQIERWPADSLKARLRLAGLVLEVQQRPAYALRLLEGAPRGTLTPAASTACEEIERQARKMIDDGVIELEGRSWH